VRAAADPVPIVALTDVVSASVLLGTKVAVAVAVVVLAETVVEDAVNVYP
jgi:hypothetical protein